MKKIALILVTVVSMALFSCGDGGGKVELASPAITYEQVGDDHPFQVSMKDCLAVKSLAVSKRKFDMAVTAQVEMVKKPSKPITYIYAGVELLDENGVRIAVVSTSNESIGDDYSMCFGEFYGINDVGDIGTMSWNLGNASDIRKIKYARVIEVSGHR